MTDDQRWAAWCDDYDRALQELHNLFFTRWMWKAITGMLEHAEVKQYVSVQNYLVRTYVATVCTGIRREVDPDPRSSSLAGCLTQLVDCPHFASRARYMDLLSNDIDRDDGASGWRIFAPDDEEWVRADLIAQDLEQLRGAANPVRRYTNKVLAHRDRSTAQRELRISLTFQEMHAVLEEVGAIAKKYFRLRNPGVELAHVTPTPDLQFFNMFQKPWWRDGYEPPDAFALG